MRLSSYLLAAPPMAALAAAQTTSSVNGLDIFLSEAYSVYTEVTSILASDAQNTASSTTSPSTSSTSTSSSSSSSSSTSSSATTGSTASLAGAAATSAAASATHSGHHSNTLAIVLGSVLGAIVLGLIILTLLICCHRRRRTKAASIENRSLSPADEEVETWRGNNSHRPDSSGGPLLGPHATHGQDHPMAAAAAPQMAEHPAYRNSHENPFTPTPPPPRRSAPNSRVGLTDGTVPGQPPFVTGNGRNSPGRNGGILSRGNGNGHHTREALAAGAGGAALGAAAMHNHNNKEGHAGADFPEKRYSGHTGSLNRKPVPSRATDGADVPLMSEKEAEGLEGGALGSGSGRRHSPQYGPEGPYTSPTLPPFSTAGHARSPSQEHLMSGAGGAAAAGAGAGLISGAALAPHHQQGHDSYDSGFYSNEGRQQSRERARMSGLSMSPVDTRRSPDNMPPDYDASNRGYGNAPAVPLGVHSRSGSNSPRIRRESTPPTVPSRSPKRTRFSDLPYDVPGGRPAGPYAESGSGSGTNSDESTYRLAPTHQVPGGWRDSAESDLHLRNSGINQHGRRSNSPRQSWDTAGPSHRASQGVSQPRLSDLKAEEEQAMLSGQRGRFNQGTIPSGEWLGHGGSGHQGEGYGHDEDDHGVGQAL